jgi:WD40 repeat protein
MNPGAIVTCEASTRDDDASPPWRKWFGFLSIGNRRWFVLAVTTGIVAPGPWWPLSRPQPPTKPSLQASGLSSVPIVNIAFSADGQTLATTDQSGLARLWHVSGDCGPAQTLKPGGHVKAVAFSFDNRYLALGGDQPHVALWDMRRNEWAPPPRVPDRSTSNLKISPDGRILAVASHDSPEILLCDLAPGRPHRTLVGHSQPVIHLAYAPDGRAIASATGTKLDSTIIIWNVATGQPERRISGPDSAMQALAWSSDNRLLAGAYPHETTVRIWDVQTGGQVQEIAGHSLSTRTVAFSPDGRLLATGAGDGAVSLWSVATAREIHRLDTQADVVHNVLFSPDGRTLIATGNDGDIRFWEIDELVGDFAGTD